MNKALMEQLELEKRKREILKEAQNNKKNVSAKEPFSEKSSSVRKDVSSVYEEALNREDSQKFAWEYELERYRRDKRRDRFYLFGMICGILALILTLYFNASEWMQWF
ncbi:hypothetical protein [Fusibacter ferrireducens]|uniref:Uncharacterized protein n=1 Tax=Fusibacter ferrireducens TaxID=2785058 RepID=A0ABR9ZQQ6_9FIRM|nr:hypothetical protein [Fusibacter ferrireducens]MBF4692792.1 hypothetical protein [Fusibacter ferrireducens]